MGKPRRKKKKLQRSLPVPARVSKFKRLTQWCVGTILGLVLLGIIVNHLSDLIPNPFRYISHLIGKSDANALWYAAGIRNNLDHHLNVGIWMKTKGVWVVDGLEPGETKWFPDTGPLYMTIQGDMIYKTNPRIQLTHTYDGEECYELETSLFDHQPTSDEMKTSPTNRIDAILGGPSPKTISFVDGTELTFDVVGPTGLKLETLIPVKYEGKMAYPFQVPESKR